MRHDPIKKNLRHWTVTAWFRPPRPIGDRGASPSPLTAVRPARSIVRQRACVDARRGGVYLGGLVSGAVTPATP